MRSIANSLPRGRWVVGLSAIPLLMASLYLTLCSPYDRRPQFRWDSQGAGWLIQESGIYWRWDYGTQHWSRETFKPDFVWNVAQVDPTPDANRPRILLEARSLNFSEGTAMRWLARLDVANNNDESDREIEFAFPTQPQPFGRHCVIGRLKSTVTALEQWLVLDLLDPSQQIQVLPLAGTGGVHVLEGTNHFVHIDDTATSSILDVYELLPGGLIKKVNGWPVGTTGLELMAETQVCTVSPDVTTLETRDALSGKLTNLRKLPAGVDRVNPSFEWGKGCLLETRSDAHGKIYQIIYDIESGRPIRTPKLTLQQWVRFDSDGLWLLVGETAQGSYAQVYDSRQHETLWEQTLGPRALGTFLDSSHIGLADHRNAITTQVVDFRNGRVIAFSQPWWWAAPLVVICGLGFAAWALLWVRSAPPGSRWGWSDLLILIMLPLVMLVTRLLSGGDRLDVNRLVMAYIQGIFIAACHLCGVWIVFGRGTRWPLRCVPFILVIAGLMCLLSYVFRSPERESLFTMIFPTMNWAWEGLATTLIPSLISMVGWLGLSRWKFSLVGEGFASEQKPARSTQWPLRDFFVAITCAAVLVACIRPFLSQLPNRVPSIPLDLIVCAAMAILAHVGLCGLAFSKRSAWLAWGTAIMVVLAISIVTLPAIDFAQHQRLAPLTERGRKFFLVSAVSLVWFYGCLLAMRYQYRLRWTMRPKPPPRVPVSFTTPAPPTNSGSLHSSHCAKQLDEALKQQSSSR